MPAAPKSIFNARYGESTPLPGEQVLEASFNIHMVVGVGMFAVATSKTEVLTRHNRCHMYNQLAAHQTKLAILTQEGGDGQVGKWEQNWSRW